MKWAFLFFSLTALGWSQSSGEKVFAQSCATGYCHGARGAPAGAPRLAGRGFDQAYITNTVMRGLPGTAMPAFGTTLSRPDLAAVVAQALPVPRRNRFRRKLTEGAGYSSTQSADSDVARPVTK
jgi:mono/diheme cytochrome c family protein